MSRVIATAQLVPAHLQEAVRRELRDGERLVWLGQPHPWLLARQMLPLMFFGMFFGGFAAAWIAAVTWMGWLAGSGGGGGGGGTGAPQWVGVVAPLFGLPFLLIGLGMVLSPFGAKRKASQTVYALTDRRAIVMNGKVFGGREVRSFSPDQLTRMKRHERRSGVGDLIFNEEPAGPRGDARAPGSRYGFIGVSAVAELERLVHHTLKLD